MLRTLVLELSDGEEMVLEGVPARRLVEDPRERTIEARRLALRRLAVEEEQLPEGNQW
jgi:hypothetical protein